ncbi:MAG: Panacea domain-containing protein [Synergistales bacterium]
MKSVFRFDERKGLEVLLYLVENISERSSNKQADLYNVLKCAFYAEKTHLGKYGRMIYGDCYIAMDYGPVPSSLYDMVKISRGDGRSSVFSDIDPKEALRVSKHSLKAKRNFNDRFLSESDKECLDEAIENYGLITFGELRNISHLDTSYQATCLNEPITEEEFISGLSNGEEVLEYLQSRPI